MEFLDWYDPKKHKDESYVAYVNIERKPIEPGQQVYYCYGRRTNRYLLLNYGFCYADNVYDSFSVFLRADLKDRPTVEQMLMLKPDDSIDSQEVRLKTDQINHMLMFYLKCQILQEPSETAE